MKTLPAPLVLALLLALFAAALRAQPATGLVTGFVLDTRTSAYLEGAEVTVAGTALNATTDRTGRFELRGVPLGSAQLSVAYPGLPGVTASATVAATPGAPLTIRLGSETVLLSAFLVSGAREGMSKAIALQKAAGESRIVAAADQFGDIFNGNVADYLKFLPGIGVDYAADDARALSLRGLSPSLTSVTMDNSPLASASSGANERRFEFEQISMSNIETIEVFKTLTPDKPATNAGGSVNLVTKSAFDRRDTLIRYRAYANLPARFLTRLRDISPMSGERTSMARPNAEFDITKRLSENLGFYFGVRNYENIRTMERSAYAYTFNPATGGLPNDPAPTEWNFYNDYAINTRRSASGRIDWGAGPRTVISLAGSWNWFDMPFTNRLYAYPFNNRPSLAFGATPVNTMSTGVSSGLGRIVNRLIQRRKSGTTYTGNFSLKHDFGAGLKLNGDVYWNKADNRYSDVSEGWFGQVDAGLTNVALRIANLGAIVPDVTATLGGVAIPSSDLSRFSVSRMFALERNAWDTRQGFALDLSKPLELAGIPFVAQIGFRDDSKLRKSEQFNRRTPTDPTVPAGAGMNALIDNIWSATPAPLDMPGTVAWINMKRAYELYGQLPRQVYENDVLTKFDERATAGYVRLDIRPRKDLLLVTGVRREEVNSDNENRFIRQTGLFHHRDDYLSLNAKYTPAPNHVFRAATAQSIGLPNYGDMLPGALTITDPTPAGARGRVSRTNPALRPYAITNYDVGYEFHFRHAGMISASVFRKDFKNYIIQATRSLTPELAAEFGLDDASFVGAPSDYDLVTRFNVPEPGRYRGVELMYSQTLGFLPGILKTIGVQLNATFISVGQIKTKQVLINGDAAQNAALVEQVAYALETNSTPRQFNAAVSWRYRDLSTMLTMNHTGRSLRGLTRSDVRYTGGTLSYFNLRNYLEARTTVDLRVEYAWSKRVVPFLQVRNLFNEKFENTQNGYLLNVQHYLDPKLEFGVRGTW